jgi:pyridinium-3,5-bisthiocarboxylic acid mononucleotide nickel chelatase
MHILYLDCKSGIAGDMFLGAMLDAGLPLKILEKELDKLHIAGFELKLHRVMKKGKGASKLHVILHREPSHHTKWLRIKEKIKGSSLPPKIKKDALGIFNLIAKAECEYHMKPENEIYFHEVGGLDSIVDIVGAAVAVNAMGISKFYSTFLNVGGGKGVFHGIEFEVPAFATRIILKGIPHYRRGMGELVTPTGAAIVKYYCRSFHPPKMDVIAEGFGAGDMDLPHPNVLHIKIGEEIGKG